MPFPHNFMAWIPTKMLGLLLHQLEFASFSLLAMKSSFHLERCAVHERFEYYSDVFPSLPNKTFGIKWKCVVSWYLKMLWISQDDYFTTGSATSSAKARGSPGRQPASSWPSARSRKCVWNLRVKHRSWGHDQVICRYVMIWHDDPWCDTDLWALRLDLIRHRAIQCCLKNCGSMSSSWFEISKTRRLSCDPVLCLCFQVWMQATTANLCHGTRGNRHTSTTAFVVSGLVHGSWTWGFQIGRYLMRNTLEGI